MLYYKERMNMKDQIKADLKAHRYNLKHLADEMCVDYAHLSAVLNGKRPMSYRTAVALRDSLNRLTDNTYNLTDFGY